MSAKCLFKSAAKEAGLTTYMNGLPCKNGHIAPRKTYNGGCTVCNRLHTAKASKKNVDKRNAYAREWRKLNPEKVAVVNRRKYLKNPIPAKEGEAARRAMKALAMPKWVDRDELKSWVMNRPAGLHIDHIVPLDGVLPDGNKVCGLHVPWNLQYVTPFYNHSKRNRLFGADLQRAESINKD